MIEAKPIVSVIMAVFNGDMFVKEAIESVLRQSYEQVELLVINDGSTDNTEEIVKQLCSQDRRIRYFAQENKGVSAARNVGLTHMNGSFFLFLDADDVLTGDSIAKRMSMFDRDPELSYCDGSVSVFDESLTTQERYWHPMARGNVFKELLSLSGYCFFGCTWMIRRDFGKKYVFETDMTHAEDLFFFISLSRDGKYDFIEDDIVLYRTSATSAMRNLIGLASGYKTLYNKVLHNFGEELTRLQRYHLMFKIRKVMTLSFLGERQFKNALWFLVTGNVR